jgi:hypothetical protein
MGIKETGNGRARAWILIQTESPEVAAHQLYEALSHEGGDSFVLVRADVVDYHYNVVVPVDAENWDVLQDLFCSIQRLTGARESAILRVVEHVPYPPHSADGYITEEEAGASTDPKQVEKIGRQRNSPAFNPWG